MAEGTQVIGVFFNFPKQAVVVLLQSFIGKDVLSRRVAGKELDGLTLFHKNVVNGIVVVCDVSA